MGLFPTPNTTKLDLTKGPRWELHFLYHPHLQQDVEAPVSIKASVSTPAILTLSMISWDALSTTGAPNVPIRALIRFPVGLPVSERPYWRLPLGT